MPPILVAGVHGEVPPPPAALAVRLLPPPWQAAAGNPFGPHPSDIAEHTERTHKEALLRFYAAHKPENATQSAVDSIFRQHRGGGVWAALVQKYGLDAVRPYCEGLPGGPSQGELDAAAAKWSFRPPSVTSAPSWAASSVAVPSLAAPAPAPAFSFAASRAPAPAPAPAPAFSFAASRAPAPAPAPTFSFARAPATTAAVAAVPATGALARHMHHLTYRGPLQPIMYSSGTAICDRCGKEITASSDASSVGHLYCAPCQYDECADCSRRTSSAVLNADGAVAYPKGGHYYCGRTVTRAGYHSAPDCFSCDGVCGPGNGCNCVACHALDVGTGRGDARGSACGRLS
jgi:hypothetical protein